jgi:hypothetical protein
MTKASGLQEPLGQGAFATVKMCRLRRPAPQQRQQQQQVALLGPRASPGRTLLGRAPSFRKQPASRSRVRVDCVVPERSQPGSPVLCVVLYASGTIRSAEYHSCMSARAAGEQQGRGGGGEAAQAGGAGQRDRAARLHCGDRWCAHSSTASGAATLEQMVVVLLHRQLLLIRWLCCCELGHGGTDINAKAV